MVRYTLGNNVYTADNHEALVFGGTNKEVLLNIIKYLWIGASCCDIGVLRNVKLETPWGVRFYDNKAVVHTTYSVSGMNESIFSLYKNGHSHDTAYDGYVTLKSGINAYSDSTYMKSPEHYIGMSAMKADYNACCSDSRIVGDIKLNCRDSSATFKSTLQLCDNSGEAITDNDLSVSDFMVWSLFDFVRLHMKKVNVILINLKGMTLDDCAGLIHAINRIQTLFESKYFCIFHIVNAPVGFKVNKMRGY